MENVKNLTKYLYETVPVPGWSGDRFAFDAHGPHGKSLYVLSEESEVLQRLLDVFGLIRGAVVPAWMFLRRPA